MYNRHCRHIASTRRPKTYMRSVVRHTTLHARGHTTQGAVLRKSQPARAPRGTVANARPLAGHAQRTQPPHSKHTTVPHVHALCHAPHGSGTSVPSVRRVAGRGLQGHVRAGHKARVMRYQGRLHSNTKRTALPPAASTALHGIGDCTCLGRKCVRQLSRGVTRQMRAPPPPRAHVGPIASALQQQTATALHTRNCSMHYAHTYRMWPALSGYDGVGPRGTTRPHCLLRHVPVASAHTTGCGPATSTVSRPRPTTALGSMPEPRKCRLQAERGLAAPDLAAACHRDVGGGTVWVQPVSWYPGRPARACTSMHDTQRCGASTCMRCAGERAVRAACAGAHVRGVVRGRFTPLGLATAAHPPESLTARRRPQDLV